MCKNFINYGEIHNVIGKGCTTERESYVFEPIAEDEKTKILKLLSGAEEKLNEVLLMISYINGDTNKTTRVEIDSMARAITVLRYEIFHKNRCLYKPVKYEPIGKKWCVVANLFRGDISYLAWQDPGWNEIGYFWTDRSSIISLARNNTPEHPFLFDNEEDAIKFINFIKLPQKCKPIQWGSVDKFYDPTHRSGGNKMKEEINVKELIDTFREMAKRGTLLARGDVSQEDLLFQIEGTIIKVAMLK